MSARLNKVMLGKVLPTAGNSAMLMATVLALTACSAEGVKRGMYEGLYQQQCMNNMKIPDCNPAHRSYEQYEQERLEAQSNSPTAPSRTR